MATHAKILNITNGFTLRRGRAEKAIRECSACWVETGVSIRNLTLAESISARNEQAKLQEPLPYAEVHGLRYEPPVSGIEASRNSRALVWQAHDFLANIAA